MNGYDFHVGLMAGKEKWTDPKAKAVFETWKELAAVLPGGRRRPDLAGRRPGPASRRRPAMYFLGMFVVAAVPGGRPGRPRRPRLLPVSRTSGPQYDAEKALDAPIDGFMLSAKSPTSGRPRRREGVPGVPRPAGDPGRLGHRQDKGNIAAAKDADTSGYTPLQKKAAELIGGAQRITQFLDRDTNPNFAGPNGMQAFLLDFLKNPTQDLDALPRRRSRTSGTRL